MGVSENSGTPKSSILIGFSIINHPFWDISIFGNPHIGNCKMRVTYILFLFSRTFESMIVPACRNPVMMGYVTVVFWRVLGGSPHLVIASLRGSQAIYKQTNPTWGLRNMVINHFLNSMTIYLGRFPNPSTTEPSTHWLNPARNRQAQ